MKYKIKSKLLVTSLTLFWAITLLVFPYTAKAQSGEVMGLIPPQSESTMLVELDDTTHPPVYITPDKTEIIRLEKDAGSIIVGNPAHLSVKIDSSKTLLFVPRQPGATHVTILDRGGKVIMQRHVVIASPKSDKYIRVRRTCTSAGGGCQPTSVYYCPDMCHDINIDANAGPATIGQAFDGFVSAIESQAAEQPTGEVE